MTEAQPNSLLDMRVELLSSFLLFKKVFYKFLTGRDYIISNPISREPREISLAKAFTKVFYLETRRLLINMPPGYGKSTDVSFFIPWAFAHYPDCQFIYTSFSSELAASHTYKIKQIMSMPHYKNMFDIEIKRDSSAKDNFKTKQGGSVKAFGSAGAITGHDAGLPFVKRFSGAIIMDDMHKPDEAHSETRRENVKRNYLETLLQRPRSPLVPLIFIGQRLHEDDLPANLINKFDGYEWEKLILENPDDQGNVLDPALHSKEALDLMYKVNRYVAWAQHKQRPQPAGGALFNRDEFVLLEMEPKILATFIVGDTAETDKTWNDATVFTFFGAYKIMDGEIETGAIGLHCLDCIEVRIEPKDLEDTFNDFYYGCMRHPVKPMLAAIEKKSTGTTLVSLLKAKPGLQVIDIERNCNSGNKTSRFLDIQPYIASKHISFPLHAKHTKMCLDHLEKITANGTHRFDDIADTFADGIKLALIDKSILVNRDRKDKEDKFRAVLAARDRKYDMIKEQIWQAK